MFHLVKLVTHKMKAPINLLFRAYSFAVMEHNKRPLANGVPTKRDVYLLPEVSPTIATTPEFRLYNLALINCALSHNIQYD